MMGSGSSKVTGKGDAAKWPMIITGITTGGSAISMVGTTTTTVNNHRGGGEV